MKNRKNLAVHLASLLMLLAGYVLTRYAFFDLHGMYQWPVLLLIAGVIAAAVSFLAGGKITPAAVGVGYILSFAIGAIFQTDGVDAGGGSTNNLWVIWTLAYAACIVIAAVADVVIKIVKRARKVNDESDN